MDSLDLGYLARANQVTNQVSSLVHFSRAKVDHF
jgi:hypothetical protein